MKLVRLFIKHTISLSILFLTLSFQAQAPELDFQINSSEFKVKNETLKMVSALIKEGRELSWKQEVENNTTTIVFAITGAQGYWDRSTGEGRLEYILKFKNFNGKLLVLRENGGANVVLTLNTKQGESLQHTFIISSLNII